MNVIYCFWNTTLILLGIGLTTTTVASLIDTSQKQSVPIRHQDSGSKGFINDIISDDNGIGIHRLQALIFNILFGITFIISFWQNMRFPEFNTSELALMGISSGAYLALKTNENKSINQVTENKEKVSSTTVAK